MRRVIRRMGQRGVTVVELMIAMLLLAIALIGLATSFPYALYGVVAGGYQTTATLLAQQSIDLARNTLYENLPTLSTGGLQAVPGYDGFQRDIQVSTVSSTTTITVVVRFSGVGGVGAGTIYDTTLVTIRTE